MTIFPQIIGHAQIADWARQGLKKAVDRAAVGNMV